MKIKIQTDDGILEVAPDAVEVEGGQLIEDGSAPEGFVPREFMQNEIQRRLKGKVSLEDAIESLASDDDLFRQVAEARGIELGDDGKPVTAGKDVDVESLKARWEREHVRPLEEQLDQTRTLTQTLKEAGLSSALQSAAAQAGVKKPLQGRFAKIFGDLFEWDPETKTWAKKSEDGDGFEYSARASDGSRYVTPAEFFDSLKGDEDYREFFEDKRPGSTDLGTPVGPNGQKVMPRSEFDKLPPQQRMQHINEGGKVVDG